MGLKYAADRHRAWCQQHGIIQSVSAKGNCYDNAVAESFFRTLKVEFIHRQKFATRPQAKAAIFEYMESYYNRIRLHGYHRSPEQFESGAHLT